MPWVFAALFAVSRIPGVMPPNFSAVSGFVLCAGAFIPGRMGWLLPLVTMVATDVGLNFYYQIAKGWEVWTWGALLSHFGNYLGYFVLWGAGRFLKARAGVGKLVAGGLLGTILFYLITNTLSWLFNPWGNPEYTKDVHGWIVALTTGAGKWDATWTFFLRSLTSSALFTALFAGSWIYAGSNAESPADKGETPVRAPVGGEAEAEEAGA
jgi:hypothetical protein